MFTYNSWIEFRTHQRLRTFGCMVAALLLLVGCDQAQLLPVDTPLPELVVASTEEAVAGEGIGSPADELGRELVLWVPEFLGAEADPNGGDPLAAAFDVFRQGHPETRIEIQTKAEFGSANLFDYVRSIQHVAPMALPQIILIDTQQLWRLVDLGIVPPLNAADVTAFSTLYPFTVEAVRYREQYYGIPFAADVIHVAHYGASIGNQTPNVWEQFLGRREPYLFPAGGRNGLSSDSLLLQYVGAGGELRPDGVLTNPEALGAVFNFWAAAVESNVISETVVSYSTLDAVWEGFVETGAGFADVSANGFLREQVNLNGIEFGNIPTRSGAPVTIGRVWAFAILSNDPEERQLALELIRELMAPDLQGRWSKAAYRLPTQEAALSEWKPASPYLEFLSRMLDVAVAAPNGLEFQEFSARLQMASVAVIKRELEPPAAVQMVQNGR